MVEQRSDTVRLETDSYRFSHLGSQKAEGYDQAFSTNRHRRMLWQLEQEILTRVLRHFHKRESLAHLDFACGTGRLLSFMRQQGVRSVGVDISVDMLKLAREKCPDAELILGDITRDDLLRGRQFDIITAFRFFPNAEDELRSDAMRVLVRHLRQEGLLVFNNHKHCHSLLSRIARFFGPGSQDGMSAAEAENLVTSSGMEVSALYHAGFLPFTENVFPLPAALALSVERMATRIPQCTHLSQDLIYVCTTRG